MKKALLLGMMLLGLGLSPVLALRWEIHNSCVLAQIESVGVCAGAIINDGTTEVTVSLDLIPELIPRDWSTSICVGENCYLNHANLTMTPGQRDTIDVNFSPSSPGFGRMRLVIAVEGSAPETLRFQGIGGITVLLLDESYDSVTAPVYRDALISLFHIVGVWDVATWGFPQDRDLRLAPKVIWIGGANSAPNPEMFEIQRIINYVNIAGRLMVSASDWGNDFQDAGMFSSYLHATYTGSASAPTTVRATVRGYPHDTYLVNGPDNLNRQERMDLCRVSTRSWQTLSYDDTASAPGFVTFGTTLYGDYHVLWLGLGFENLGTVDSRVSLMDGLLWALDNEMSAPLSIRPEDGSLRVWPNPATGPISLSMPRGTDRVSLLDITGRVIEEHVVPASGTLELRTDHLTPAAYQLRTPDGNGTTLTITR